MLRPAEIVDLGEWLRRNDFSVSTHHLIAVARLVAGSRNLGATASLGRWLAPIFCSDAAQQARFDTVYADWLRQRGIVDPDDGDTSPAKTDDPARPPSRRRRGAGLAIAATFVLLLGSTAAWYCREQHVDVKVVDVQGQPIPQARVLSPQTGADIPTDDNSGQARLPFHRWHLRLHVEAMHPDFTPSSVEIGDTNTPRLTLTLVRQPKQPSSTPSAAAGHRFSAIAAPARRQGPDINKPGGLRLDPAAAAMQALMLLAVAGWWLFALVRRRGFLERLPGSETDLTRQLHASRPSALGGLASDLRHLGRELRRRREIHSPTLDVTATIAANLQRAGPLELVFGTRAEPDYIALVDRASPMDHQTCLADEVIRSLLAQGVSLERYEFDADPRRALHRPLGTSALHHGPQGLEQLAARHPDAKLIVFSDGRGLVDRYTGQPASWLPELTRWPNVAMVTPQPSRQWRAREWRLRQAGLTIVPLDGDGLRILGEVFRADRSATAVDAGSRERQRPAYLRELDVLLDRSQPDADTLRTLMLELERDLGPDGMAWLAGIAVYPELHWEITLVVGEGLLVRPGMAATARPIGDSRRHAHLLAQLSRLPWLRWGYMPDWLRNALLRRLSPTDDDAVRGALEAFLATVSDKPSARASADLRVAVPARDPSWRDALAGVRAWFQGKPLPDTAEDRVFLRFMSGPRPRLAVEASDRLMRLFYRDGAPLAGPRSLPLALVAAVCVAIGWVAPPLVRAVNHEPAPITTPVPSALALNENGSLVAVEDDRGQLRLQFIGPSPDRAAGNVRACPRSSTKGAVVLQFTGVATLTTMQPGLIDRRAYALAGNGACDVSENKAPLGPAALPGLPDAPPQPVTAAEKSDSADADVGCAATAGAGTAARTVDRRAIARLTGRAAGSVRCAVSADATRLGILSPENELFVLPLKEPFKATARPVSSLPAGSAPTALAVSADGLTAAVVRADGSLWVLQSGNWQSLGLLQAKGPLALSGDGRTLAFADETRDVQLWSLDKPVGRNVLLSIISDAGPGLTTTQASASPARIGDALVARYGFERTGLSNPSADEVLQALRKLTTTLNADDRLVILFAGSTQPSSTSTTPGWLLRGTSSSAGSYLLSGEQVSEVVASMPARDVLAIVDLPVVRALASALPRRPPSRDLSRWVLAANTPQADEADAFRIAVANVLRTATQPLTGAVLSQTVNRRLKAGGGPDTASYVAWLGAGHSAGSLLLTPVGPGQPELPLPALRKVLQTPPLPASPAAIADPKPENRVEKASEKPLVTPAPEARAPDGSMQTAASPPDKTPLRDSPSERVTYAADVFFDQDKATLKDVSKPKLDDLLSKIAAINLEVILAIGHSDVDGKTSDANAERISVRRAEAVKSYFVSKGIEANRIYTEGKGNKQPVADNKTAEGRAKNRRVEIEVVGTRPVAPAQPQSQSPPAQTQ